MPARRVVDTFRPDGVEVEDCLVDPVDQAGDPDAGTQHQVHDVVVREGLDVVDTFILEASPVVDVDAFQLRQRVRLVEDLDPLEHAPRRSE